MTSHAAGNGAPAAGELPNIWSVRYSDRLAANDIVASVGSKGVSYDNALVESFHGL